MWARSEVDESSGRITRARCRHTTVNVVARRQTIAAAHGRVLLFSPVCFVCKNTSSAQRYCCVEESICRQDGAYAAGMILRRRSSGGGDEFKRYVKSTATRTTRTRISIEPSPRSSGPSSCRLFGDGNRRADIVHADSTAPLDRRTSRVHAVA